jgi:hypothetical protein
MAWGIKGFAWLGARCGAAISRSIDPGLGFLVGWAFEPALPIGGE